MNEFKVGSQRPTARQHQRVAEQFEIAVHEHDESRAVRDANAVFAEGNPLNTAADTVSIRICTKSVSGAPVGKTGRGLA